MAITHALYINQLIPPGENSESQRALWIDDADDRDSVMKFYIEWQALSDEQRKLHQDKARREKTPDPQTVINKIESSFSIFANGGTGKNLKDLTYNQGYNQTLARFLACEKIYAIANPLNLLYDAVEREDVDNIQAIAFFIVSNFRASSSDLENVNKNIEAMFTAVLEKEATKESQDELENGPVVYAPKNVASARRAQTFAYAVASLAFKHTSHVQLSQHLLVSICAIGKFNPEKNLDRWWITNAMIRVAHWVTRAFGFSPPLAQPVTDRLQKSIELAMRRHQERLSSLSPECLLLKPADFNNPEKVKEAQQRFNEIQREKNIAKNCGESYDVVALKALAIVEYQGISLNALRPYMKAQEKRAVEIARQNRKMAQQDPYTSPVFYTVEKVEINVRVEALRAARLEAAKLKANNQKVPPELSQLLQAVENGILKLGEHNVPKENIILDIARQRHANFDSLSPEDQNLRCQSIKVELGFENASVQAHQEKYVDEPMKAALDWFKKNPGKHLYYDKKTNFPVVKVESPGQRPKYYLVRAQEIGSGAFGRVFQAYPIRIVKDKSNNKHLIVDRQRPAILKRIPANIATDAEVQQELEAIRKIRKNVGYVKIPEYYHNKKIGVKTDCHFLFADYVPGKPLRSTHGEHSILPELTLEERMSAIVDLLEQLNALHNAGIVHSDINQENILLHRNSHPTQTKVVAYLIDCGKSRAIRNADGAPDPTVLMNIQKTDMTPIAAPPEAISMQDGEQAQIGLKSDVFSMTLQIAELLNAQNPGKHKVAAKTQIGPKQDNESDENYKVRVYRAIRNKGYDIDDVLNNFSLPKELVDTVKEFLNRMQSMDYQKRPTVQECLTFFKTFQALVLNCCDRSDFNFNHENVREYCEILSALAHPGGPNVSHNDAYVEGNSGTDASRSFRLGVSNNSSDDSLVDASHVPKTPFKVQDANGKPLSPITPGNMSRASSLSSSSSSSSSSPLRVPQALFSPGRTNVSAASNTASVNITTPGGSPNKTNNQSSVVVTSPEQSVNVTTPNWSLFVTPPHQNKSLNVTIPNQSLVVTSPERSQNESLEITRPAADQSGVDVTPPNHDNDDSTAHAATP